MGMNSNVSSGETSHTHPNGWSFLNGLTIAILMVTFGCLSSDCINQMTDANSIFSDLK